MTPRRAALALAGVLLAALTVLGGAATAVAAPAAAPTATTPATALTASAPGATGESDSLVLVGTGGLTWTDVDQERTPNLWGMLQQGSSAALTVRSVFTNTCPVDGWLSLSGGNRAAALNEDGSSRRTQQPCTPPQPVTAAEDGSATVPGWSAYVRAANQLRFGTVLGTLEAPLADAGVCLQAIGPGAAIAAANTEGGVARYADYDPSTLTGLVSGCRVTIVDVGSLRDPDDVAPEEPAGEFEGSREEQAAAIDARIGEVLAAAPSGADVIVASLSDAGSSERLRLLVAQGPHFGPGKLYSPSVRAEGLAQSADLTVTVLTSVGAEVPEELGGLTLRREADEGNSAASARDRLRDLVDYDDASHRVRSMVQPFFQSFVAAQIVIYAFTLLVWKRRFGSTATRDRLLSWVRVVTVAAASVPAATFLANVFPWWRFPLPMLAVVGAVGIWVALFTALALAGPWGRTLMGPPAVVSLATLVTLAADVMTGSRLQLSSLMGLQPVIGGRFYGFGNVTFAIFATAALVLSIAVSHWLVQRDQRRAAALAVSVIGLFAVVVDGNPAWGADGGGPPAMLPAFAFFVLAVLGTRLTWVRAVVIVVVTAGLFLLVAFLDSLRPVESRSHLGRFWDTLLAGDAWDIVVRKLDQNIDVMFNNYPLTFLVPVALVFVIAVLARPTSWGSRALQRSFDRVPTLRPGLLALLVMLVIGFGINDSGVAIPAVAATVAVPLIIAISVRTLQDEVRSEAGSRVERRHY